MPNESETGSADVFEQSAEEIVDGILEQTHFSGTAYIVKNGSVIYAKGRGIADRESGAENTVDTVFRIASNTKQFTAAAVMLLQEEGKLSVDNTLDAYFPDYPYAGDITVHQLLCMRSGIKDYMAYTDPYGNHVALRESELGYSVSGAHSAAQNKAAVREWVFAQELNFTPGAQFEYSNTNYSLLADIIEQASGMTYEEYIRTRIFEPLGMTASDFVGSRPAEGAAVAQPQRADAELAYLNEPGMSFGAGDMLSNAVDIAKWLNALTDGSLLTQESWEAMITDYSGESDIMRYGYGLMIEDEGVYHSGYLPSYSSLFYTAVNRNDGIILMSNNPSGNIETVAKRIRRELGN